MKPPVLYLVVPCYNEQEVLDDTAHVLTEKLSALIACGSISAHSRVVFVNDGSRDGTWQRITAWTENNKLCTGINLAHNEGHQNALLAGLMTVRPYADVTVSMDADLQDDVDAVDGMLEKYAAGTNIVYGVRASRETDTFFKRFTAESFYRVMRGLGADIVFNHADFRLMDRRALDALAAYPEVNLFLRGLVPMIGLAHDVVYYSRAPRRAGESKYPWRRMASFAWEGVTSPHPTHRADGYVHLLCERIDPPVVDLPPLHRRDHRRLDESRRLAVVPRRADSALDWRHRRVCRQNLFGSQAAAALPCAGFYRRTCAS